jgi:hypothetical protein
MSIFIEVALNTKYGSLTAAVTDNDHVSIQSGALNTTPLVVRGVEYHAHIHLHWIADKQIWDTKPGEYIYISRSGGKDPSWPARKTVQEAMVAAWVEYVTEHPEVLRQAHIQHLGRELTGLDEQIIETEVKLTQLRKAREEMDKQLQAA